MCIIGRAHDQCVGGQWADYRCDASEDDEDHPIGFICEINPEKQGEWWEDGNDDDDDVADDDDDERKGTKGRDGAKEDHNPTAIVFALIGCLGFTASVAYHVVQRRRRQSTQRPWNARGWVPEISPAAGLAGTASATVYSSPAAPVSLPMTPEQPLASQMSPFPPPRRSA